MNPTIEGYAAAVLEEAAEEPGLALVVEELSAIQRLVVSNAALESALTDSAVPVAARRAVLRDLLEGRVSAPATRLANFAVGAVTPPELPAAFDWLAIRAAQQAERGAPPELPPAHLEGRRRVGGFATALYEELEVHELEEMEDELFRFARTVETAPALRALLTDRDQPLEVRAGVVEDLLHAKVQPATLRLVHFAVGAGRARDLVGTLFWLVDQTAAARGWRVARVRAAAELDQAERRELTESLQELTGGPVELQVTLEPELLAGVVVRIGDLQVDASAKGRLDQLSEYMTAGGWHDALDRAPQRSRSEGAG